MNLTQLLEEAVSAIGTLETKGVHPAVVNVLHLLASAIQAHKAQVEEFAGNVAGKLDDAAAASLESVH